MKKYPILLMLMAAVFACRGESQTLKPVEPAKNVSVSLLRSDWKTLVEQRKKMEYNKGEMKKNLHFPLAVNLKWEGGKPPFTLEITGSGNAGQYRIEKIAVRSFRVVNLMTATEYEWSVSDAGGNRVKNAFRTLPGARLIELPDRECGPVNLRDLGGRISKFGGRVRQGLIYRGSALNTPRRFSEKNRLFMVGELKIKTDLDLRYPKQVVKEKQSGIGLLGSGVKWIHCPVNAYKSFTPEQNELFRDTIRIFAQKENYPVYLHCAGGVDRTGEISFLLNAIAGVSDEDLLEEYELSSLSLYPRPRTIPYFRTWLKGIASFSDAGKPFSEQVEQYLLKIGLSREELDRIRENLLDRNSRPGTK